MFSASHKHPLIVFVDQLLNQAPLDGVELLIEPSRYQR
ncbi:hypothetical protein EV07_1690 [Prochlorococcus sp. MIT 0603]|nr:hypothetical protein EV07_1690 [Prochlorococcus sp. MIT 0603]